MRNEHSQSVQYGPMFQFINFSAALIFNCETVTQINIESQNHRMIEWEESSEAFWSNFRSATAGCSGLCLLECRVPPTMEIPQSTKQYLYLTVFDILRGTTKGSSKTLPRNYYPRRPSVVPLSRLLIDPWQFHLLDPTSKS